jgi:hypothetical protein
LCGKPYQATIHPLWATRTQLPASTDSPATVFGTADFQPAEQYARKMRMSPTSVFNLSEGKLHIFALLALTLLGAYLRFLNLSQSSVWGDEAMTAFFASDPHPITGPTAVRESGRFEGMAN